MAVPLLVYILVDILYRISANQHPGNLEEDVIIYNTQFYPDAM